MSKFGTQNHLQFVACQNMNTDTFQLRYETETIHLNIDGDYSAKRTVIDGITLTDSYKPSENQSRHGRYTFILTKEVPLISELADADELIRELCSKINTLLTYIIGRPLHDQSTDYYGSRKKLIPFGEHAAWNSNYEELRRKLQLLENPEQKIFVSIKSTQTKWATLPKSPFESLETLIRAYPNSSFETKLIIRFHALALRHEYDVKHLLLAKALEIFKSQFKSLKSAFKFLHEDIRDEFGEKDLGWLFNLSNTRFETRHAVGKKPPKTILPEMSDHEYDQFIFLTDLVLSNYVRQKLGLNQVLWKR
jgi:hypothetical protein